MKQLENICIPVGPALQPAISYKGWKQASKGHEIFPKFS